MKFPDSNRITRHTHPLRVSHNASDARAAYDPATTCDAPTTRRTSAIHKASEVGEVWATRKTCESGQPYTDDETRTIRKTYADGEGSTPAGSRLPLIIGHRGASAVTPENTIKAFERALDDGADGIEFDVRLARDGVPVVIHDATLRRTAGIDAPVAALSSSDLSAIDVGSWFNRRHPTRAADTYVGETVPTLARVFATVAPRCRLLYVELKCEAGETASLVERVVSEVRSHELNHRVVIESFTLAAVAEAKRIAPELRTAAAFERRPGRPLPAPRTLLKRAIACRADELALARSLTSRRTVEAARACGLQTVVWTVDHPSWFRRACLLGLRAVITNDPAKFSIAREDFLKHQ